MNYKRDINEIIAKRIKIIDEIMKIVTVASLFPNYTTKIFKKLK